METTNLLARMSYKWVGLCTYCADTPENWRDFERLKLLMREGRTRLTQSFSAENRELKDYLNWRHAQQKRRR